MNAEETLIKGLTATPKYIPMWYFYDKQGLEIFNKIQRDNCFYYMHSSEMTLLNQHVQDLIGRTPSPVVLVDMGSGNCEKSRIFIDAILDQQVKLNFVPVDISQEFLYEESEKLARDYGDKINVRPIAADYSIAIDMLRNIPGNKLIVWLGGGLQNEMYSVQVDRLRSLAQVMSGKDKLIISLDVTQNAEEIENAYFPTDAHHMLSRFYLNALWRLNREYNGNIDMEKLELERKYIRNTEPTATSNVIIRAKAKEPQSCDIDGLGISFTLQAGEYINMFEGEGFSCKYTIEQIRTLVQTGSQKLENIWVDQNQHVAVCCLGKG